MVTIIVLIILAGVTINLTLGDSGIFNKAKYTKQGYLNDVSKEEKEIAKLTNELDTKVSSNRDDNMVTIPESEYLELQAKAEALTDYSITDEQVVGTWYDGKTMYQKNIAITAPTYTSGNPTVSNISLSTLNIDSIIIKNGYLKPTDGKTIFSSPLFLTSAGKQIKVYYNASNKSLDVANGETTYSGATGYVTIQYTKK